MYCYLALELFGLLCIYVYSNVDLSAMITPIRFPILDYGYGYKLGRSFDLTSLYIEDSDGMMNC